MRNDTGYLRSSRFLDSFFQREGHFGLRAIFDKTTCIEMIRIQAATSMKIARGLFVFLLAFKEMEFEQFEYSFVYNM